MVLFLLHHTQKYRIKNGKNSNCIIYIYIQKRAAAEKRKTKWKTKQQAKPFHHRFVIITFMIERRFFLSSFVPLFLLLLLKNWELVEGVFNVVFLNSAPIDKRRTNKRNIYRQTKGCVWHVSLLFLHRGGQLTWSLWSLAPGVSQRWPRAPRLWWRRVRCRWKQLKASPTSWKPTSSLASNTR